MQKKMQKKSLNRQARGRKSYHRGWWAEWAALAHMLGRGYWPRAWRYRAPGGELDWILQRGDIVVALEVKARPDFQTGHESMPHAEWARRRSAMQHFLRRNPHKNWSIRFDLIVVAPYFQIQHVENAWQPVF
jgi:putative endonuclease